MHRLFYLTKSIRVIEQQRPCVSLLSKFNNRFCYLKYLRILGFVRWQIILRHKYLIDCVILSVWVGGATRLHDKWFQSAELQGLHGLLLWVRLNHPSVFFGEFITSCSRFIWDSSKARLNSLCMKVFDGNYYFILFYSAFLKMCLSLSLLPTSPSPSMHPFFPVMTLLPSLAVCVPPHPLRWHLVVQPSSNNRKLEQGQVRTHLIFSVLLFSVSLHEDSFSL